MEDGRLGLVDYGACSQIDHPTRETFAKLLISLASGNDEATLHHFTDFGVRSVDMNPKFLLPYALICYHRGFHPEDMKRVGIPDDVGVMELDLYMATIDTMERFPSHVATTQRMAMVLLGVAQSIGAGTISIASAWKPHAEAYLKSRGIKFNVGANPTRVRRMERVKRKELTRDNTSII
jgi:aarF domain-containing kinase